MLNKGDCDITKHICTMLNQPIPIKNILESNKRLTKVCWLHIGEDNMLLIHQEIQNNFPNSLKSYLLLRHWVNGYDGQIMMLGTRTHQNHMLHGLARLDVNLVQTLRDERRWISAEICH